MTVRATIAVLFLGIAGPAPAARAEPATPAFGKDLVRDVEWRGIPIERLHVGGWLDASFLDSDLDGEGSNFAVNHLNGFLDLRFAEHWQLFVESEIEYRPEVERFERESEFEVEQGYLAYAPSDALDVRVGRFSTPFGYWTPLHWTIANDTILPPLHDARRLVPEQQVGASLHGRLFPEAAGRDLQLDWSIFGGYASEQTHHERAHGPTAGADLRITDETLGFAGVSVHRQRSEAEGLNARTRETSGVVYGEVGGPWDLTFRGEYAIQRSGGRTGAPRYRHWAYGKVRWDYRRLHLNYRLERADDEAFGPDAEQWIHRWTLGYAPTPRLRLRAEVAQHDLRQSAASDFRSWGLWLGVFF